MSLPRAIGKRLAAFGLSLLVASILVFVALNLLPGDVAQVILGQNADPASVEALRQQMGLDRPLIVRYFEWMGGLLTGNLGTSALTGERIGRTIMSRLGVTLWLVILGMALALAIALPVGKFAAVNRKKPSGQIVGVFSQFGMAIPAFLAGIVLVLVFAVKLRWLPANGYVRLLRDPLEWLLHIILPVVSLALVQSAVLTRYVRNAYIDVLSEDYLRTARAIGWTQNKALTRHGLRNASLQIITVLGLQLATLFVGAIVVETVFVLPGLGSYLLASVNQRELPIVQSITMILVALVLIINTIVDVAYLLLDPRLRVQTSGDEE